MKILTFNIKMRPIPFQRNKDRGNQISNLISAKHFDILCLQEHFTSKYKFLTGSFDMDLNTFLPELECVYSPMTSSRLTFCDSGLAIYTRFEVLHTLFYPFSKSKFIDRVAEKGVLYAKLRLSPTTMESVHVFNTHTQSGNRKSERKVRASQIEELYSFIHDITKNDNYKIIIAGDFNEDVSTEIRPEFRAYENCPRTGKTFKNERLDFIIIQHHTRTRCKRVSLETFNNLSDHLGVSITI